MFFIIMTVFIPGLLLLIDRYKYFMSDIAKAGAWFIFVVQSIVLIASLIEGKPLVFA